MGNYCWRCGLDINKSPYKENINGMCRYCADEADLSRIRANFQLADEERRLASDGIVQTDERPRSILTEFEDVGMHGF